MFDFDVRSGYDQAAPPPPVPPPAAEPSTGHQRPPAHEVVGLFALGEDLCQPIAVVPRRQPVVVAPSLSLQSVLEAMRERHADAALVASHGILLGVVRERDLIHRAVRGRPATGDLPVAEVMAIDFESLLETDGVDYAVRKLWSLGGIPMPVVRPNGSFCGLLETQDIVAWLCDRIATRGMGGAKALIIRNNSAWLRLSNQKAALAVRP